ncbi:hypothetical protein LTR97_009681 [Elasticomyces elasticus]|uniref:Uncharacterized protein n=1 Tax=Elasticomyces elasticus TaxID=574655 RepID=A0AAN7W4K8_9PEZI|nr:hypothetical protein LTR97_009681 [Elasticomyces elasticus]
MAVIKSTVTSSRNKKNSCDELWDQADFAAALAVIERDLEELWRKVRGDAAVAEESNEEDEGIMVLGGVRNGLRTKTEQGGRMKL